MNQLCVYVNVDDATAIKAIQFVYKYWDSEKNYETKHTMEEIKDHESVVLHGVLFFRGKTIFFFFVINATNLNCLE